MREALQLGEQAGAPALKQAAAAGLAWLALERGDLSQTRVWLAEFYAYGGEAGKSVLATVVEGGLALRDGNLDAAMAIATPSSSRSARFLLPSMHCCCEPKCNSAAADSTARSTMRVRLSRWQDDCRGTSAIR